MNRGLRIVAVAFGAGLLQAGGASASTLSVVNMGKSDAVVYEAEPGEENRVKAESAAGLITVRDPGAEVTAGAECDQVSDHKATCQRFPGPVNQALIAELGNKGDRADALTGILWQELDGGPGDDELEGGGGFDFLNGGTGADLIDGAGFIDVVSYFERSEDLTLTLGDKAANDGGNGDDGASDRILRVENAVGGSGDDFLSGTGGENTLSGAGGADVHEAKGGEDVIYAGEGADVLRGGRGQDNLQPQDGADRSFGGAGKDVMSINADERPDLIDGGGQREDEIQFGFGVAFRVELDGKPNDGLCDQSPCSTSSEGDNMRRLGILEGQSGADLLIGSGASETFQPGNGADTVKAKGGDDEVALFTNDGADDILCGGGVDTVDGEQVEDDLTDCEN